MVVLVGFAFLSGIVTILSPCILPMLPVVLSGSVTGSHFRSLGIVSAFVLSFTLFTLGLSALVAATGLSPDALRFVAVAVLVAFGLILLVPFLKDRFQLAVSALLNRFQSKGVGSPADGRGVSAGSPSAEGAGNKKTHPAVRDFLAGLPLGLSLGLVWTPCVGPIMASIITLALSQSVDGASVLITLSYSLGTAVPMFAVMAGGRGLLKRLPWLNRNMAGIQKVFAVLMIVTGIGIAFGAERQVQRAILEAFPAYGTGLTQVEENEAVKKALEEREGPGLSAEAGSGSGTAPALPVAAPEEFPDAPPLVARGPWLQSAPLTMAELKGKVVLVDFWTYSCINCVRTLPYLRSWYSKYKDKGFVIIGVHSPEFEFEKSLSNVRQALGDLGVTWPVVLDNDFAQWKSYKNRYWPAHYLIDTRGKVRYRHFGEGRYEETERTIQTLLAEGGTEVTEETTAEQEMDYAQTPETYLGSARQERFKSLPALDSVTQESKAVRFRKDGPLGPNEWNLEGAWKVSREYLESDARAVLELSFEAKDVYLVAEPTPKARSAALRVSLLPEAPGSSATGGTAGAERSIPVDKARMYHLLNLESSKKGTLRLEVPAGLRLFAFTFGGG